VFGEEGVDLFAMVVGGGSDVCVKAFCLVGVELGGA
jgi:hypothetical protein